MAPLLQGLLRASMTRATGSQRRQRYTRSESSRRGRCPSRHGSSTPSTTRCVMHGYVYAVHGYVDAVHGYVDAVHGYVDAVHGYVDAVHGYVDAVHGYVDAVHGYVDAVHGYVDAVCVSMHRDVYVLGDACMHMCACCGSVQTMATRVSDVLSANVEAHACMYSRRHPHVCMYLYVYISTCICI
jgi:hypothetical protein